MTSQALYEQAAARTRTPIDTTSPNFADPSFDPAEFLNNALPPLSLASSQRHASRAPGSVPIAELSSQVQSLLSQINALNVRHSGTLNSLTDEIIRSGSRLAYEVEVLRGEAIGLSDTLTDALHDDIVKFVPEGLETGDSSAEPPQVLSDTSSTSPAAENRNYHLNNGKPGPQDPEYITKLRTLNQVRAHLEDVVRTFGEAMEWPLPPSETSIASSFISVSAPDTSPEAESREEKGQEAAKKILDEILELLDSDGGKMAGIEAATHRVESLRALATVWKGTAEEKARNRFVNSLAKMVDDRRRALDSQSRDLSDRSNQQPSTTEQSRDNESGGGFLWNLQRLRDEIYLE